MDVKQAYPTVDEKKSHGGVDFEDSHRTADQYLCAQCEQSIPWDEKTEHEDWHFAKDLQEQDGPVVSQPPTHNASQPQSKAGPQPPDYAPPPGPPPQQAQQASYAPPSHPPPQQGQSRAKAIYNHTNQVIEAAKVRARDEVRVFAPI